MTKLKQARLTSRISIGLLVLVVLVGAGLMVSAYMGGDEAPKMVIEGDQNFYEASSGDGMVGAMPGPNVMVDTTFHRTIRYKDKTQAIAQTGATTTVTLTSTESGTTFILSGTGTNIILPDVDFTGANYKFQVGGAMGVANMIIDSAEGDNIEGTLIVAGAVVDCAAEDQINFVVDGENIGDYFEIMSDGTQWLLGDSGVLTASKLTCTDPS